MNGIMFCLIPIDRVCKKSNYPLPAVLQKLFCEEQAQCLYVSCKVPAMIKSLQIYFYNYFNTDVEIKCDLKPSFLF